MADDLRQADRMQQMFVYFQHLRRYTREPVKLSYEPVIGDITAPTHEDITHPLAGEGRPLGGQLDTGDVAFRVETRPSPEMDYQSM